MSLKDLTAIKHKEAERKEFNQRMFRGELTKEEYRNYLLSQLAIFSEIEKFSLPNINLLRRDKIIQDLKELYPEIIIEDFNNGLSTDEYVKYISGLNDDTISPHVYLNYLALVFGGQMMKTKIPGSGHMYDFDDMVSVISSIRTIQKDEWADEVNKGFDFIIKILDELQELSR